MSTAAVAIVAATAASYVLGSLWYVAIGKRWRSALGWTQGPDRYRPRPAELATALVGQVIMVAALWVVIGRLALIGIAAGSLAGVAIWLGFVLPTLATNVVFQRRSLSLVWQDGGHWLLLLAAQGAVLGYLR